MDHWKDRALRSLENGIRACVAPSRPPLECDRWIASSTLQKAIRRGEIETAQRAALTLYTNDRSGVWRRLIAIAFEDVGPADVALVVETVAVATAPEWRAQHGDTRALFYLTHRIAEAPKDRSADYLMWATSAHPSLDRMRRLCASIPMAERREICRDLPIYTALSECPRNLPRPP